MTWGLFGSSVLIFFVLCPEMEFGLMAASKSKTSGSLASGMQVVRLLLRPQNRGLVLTAVVFVASIGGTFYAWQRWGEPSLHSGEYSVTADQIIVTPQPTWIQANVKTEVLRSAGFTRVELGDRKLIEHLAQAFALHPWVAKVVRVEKRYPPQVLVDLHYRRPVLAVKVDVHGEQNVLVVDENAVLLPSSDFSPSQARGYLRIMGEGESPGIYGTPWGSERIAGAARLAATWGECWQALRLYWIVAARPASGELLYELRTQDDKVRVVWGAAPGHESKGEPTAIQKIAALEQYVHEKGPLNRDGGAPMIDLRELAAGKKDMQK
jgi:hypothetical protein